mgnify:CR=1 FL=1
MAQQYTNHDLALSSHAILSIFKPDPFVGPVAPGAIAPVGIVRETLIPFQFPPTISSDNRKGNWIETEMPGREPEATIAVAGAREITLKWTYIVDAVNNGWTTSKIAKQVHTIRGYFATLRQNVDHRNQLVLFRYGLFGGKEATSARIRSIDVKHGDTMIIPPNEPEKAFPLRTDITLDLRLWNRSTKVDFVGLIDITPEWY